MCDLIDRDVLIDWIGLVTAEHRIVLVLDGAVELLIKFFLESGFFPRWWSFVILGRVGIIDGEENNCADEAPENEEASP